jgi:hypothetical protein
MKRVLALVGVSALAAVALVDVSDAIARDAAVGSKGAAGGVSVGRDSVSARGGGTSVSASRDGASVRGGGTSVTASRDGASVRGGGTSVSASRDGASVRSGGTSVTASRDGASVTGGGTSVTASADDRSTGSVNARGDREYPDFASWMEDLRSWWSGDKPEGGQTVGSESGTSKSSSVEQVSEATATDGGSAVARNTNVTRQN